jgi:hypothetical protein
MRGVVLVPGPRKDVLWLDENLAMRWAYFDDLLLWPDPRTGGGGGSTLLGGSFRSPPTAVAIGLDRVEVFGLGTDYALLHKTYLDQQDVGTWSANWENLGGDLTSTPVVVSTAADRLDIFALGPDQGMLHRRRTGAAWSAWEELGGCFTSAPAILPAGLDTFDIFARGPDYLIYRSRLTTAGLSDWAALGGGLLREPIAASAPAAVQLPGELYVFVVAADGAMWFTRFDGTVWKPWSSLGGSFVSEPVAIALVPEIDRPGTRIGRIDVFGVRSGDHALLHNWLDLGSHPVEVPPVAGRPQVQAPQLESQGWQDDWIADTDGQPDTLPLGHYTTAPGISLADPAPTRFERPPANFLSVQPDPDGTIHALGFTDGQGWGRHDYGPDYLLPSTYVFSIYEVDVTSTRSAHEDTDIMAATFGVGARAPQSLRDSLGKYNSGSYDFRDPQGESTYRLGPATVELSEPAAFSWSIVNSGNSDAEHTVGSVLTRALEDAANDYLKDWFKGDKAAGEAGLVGAAWGGPLGSLVGAALGVALDWVLGFIFTDCDGIVAVGSLAYPNGRLLQTAVLEAPGRKLTGSTAYVGDDPGQPCGAPHYTVKWSIHLAGSPLNLS